MTEKKTTPSLDRIQKLQIEEWLKETDKLIRSGRYLAADELLQKVFSLDPFNDIANSYQDRIQFLIKQFSQRVGIDVEKQIEIRMYTERQIERNRNKLQSFLITAQKAIEEGYFKKASDYIQKALSIDPENTYAKELKYRLSELQSSIATSNINTETNNKFRSVLQESWREGIPSQEKQNILKKLQQQMKISDEVYNLLEREAKNALYKEELFKIWTTGGISAFSQDAIEKLRKKYDISNLDHSLVERELLREVRKNKLKGTILVVDEDSEHLLEIVQTLRINYYAVAAANNIEEGITTLKQLKPDAIISEVYFNSLPSGFELYEFMRSIPQISSTHFFFTSKSFDRTTILIGKRLGVTDFFQKPIDYELLLATLAGRMTINYQKHSSLQRK